MPRVPESDLPNGNVPIASAKADSESVPPAISRRVLISGAAVGLGLAATAVLPRDAEAQTEGQCFFALEIDGFSNARFSNVNGLGSQTVSPEGGENVIRKLPGATKWGDIELKRGITSDLTFYDWRKMIEDGELTSARKNGSIISYDQNHTEVARWNFTNAWPSKYYVESNNSGSDGCAWEVVTLAVDFVRRVEPRR